MNKEKVTRGRDLRCGRFLRPAHCDHWTDRSQGPGYAMEVLEAHVRHFWNTHTPFHMLHDTYYCDTISISTNSKNENRQGADFRKRHITFYKRQINNKGKTEENNLSKL